MRPTTLSSTRKCWPSDFLVVRPWRDSTAIVADGEPALSASQLPEDDDDDGLATQSLASCGRVEAQVDALALDGPPVSEAIA